MQDVCIQDWESVPLRKLIQIYKNISMKEFCSRKGWKSACVTVQKQTAGQVQNIYITISKSYIM